jgi:hypothetical protein
MSSAATAIDILESMTVDERIAEVAKDVLSRTDRYKGIAAHDLAELLGISNPHCPDGDWDFVNYAAFVPAERLLEEYGADEMLELLEYYLEEYADKMLELGHKALGPERLEQLKQATNGLDPKSALSLFSADEQRAMERVHQEYEAGNAGSVDLAYHEVRSAHDKLLMFEAWIEDGGVCEHLLTPYDRRDGKFTDLTGCLILFGEPLAALTGQS